MKEEGGSDDAPTEKRPSEGSTQIEHLAPPPERPSEAAPPGTDSSDGGSGLSLATPRETLLVQEIGRTRAFMRVAIGMAVVQLGALAVLDGDGRVKGLFMGALAAVIGACGWLLWKIRDDAGYTVGRALVSGYACVTGA